MLAPKELFDALASIGIEFYTGVPDSTLKDFCAYVSEVVPGQRHIIAANEGGAVAIACGSFLATGKPGLVYMQNSGLGNAVNPLVSLADPLVYGIPMLLLLGYRGEPCGEPDEPQHAKQGQITIDLLGTLGIGYGFIPDTIENAKHTLNLAKQALNEGKVFALVARPGLFARHVVKPEDSQGIEIEREDAVIAACREIGEQGVIVSTTGKISRELYEYRERVGAKHDSDFLVVGSMGHVSQIALGIALSKPEKSVYCFDGDGSVIMHMGSLAIAGQAKPANFHHIVFNNGGHESVGGQRSAGFDVDIPRIAAAAGYVAAFTVTKKADMVKGIRRLVKSEGPALLEIVVRMGSRSSLGRPRQKPSELMTGFMKQLSGQNL